MGEGGLAKSVQFVDQGKREGFRIVYAHIFQDVFLPKLHHMIEIVQIFVKYRGKNCFHTKIELMNWG